MPINKETIISVFDDKLTLMQWLKTINKALEDAVLTGVEITKKGNATLSFKFTFEDGTYLETNDLVLQQGESVENAYIQNGHLYLTLTNGTNLDAGDVKPVSNFSIDANQHLIVNYADGTSQDLGAIFNGNVNIAGNFTADSIIENMTGYTLSTNAKDSNVTLSYAGVVKNGNKLTFVVAGNVTKASGVSSVACDFIIPRSIADKLVPILGDYIASSTTTLVNGIFDNNPITKPVGIAKLSGYFIRFIMLFLNADLQDNISYMFRIEQTFLLSDNLVQ